MPIEGLTREDFDDQEPVEITNFFRVEAGQRIEPAAESGAAESAAESSEPFREPSSIVVLVDHPFISPMSRRLVFDRLDERLDDLLSDSTQIMVVSKTRNIEIAQHRTSGRASSAENDIESLTLTLREAVSSP